MNQPKKLMLLTLAAVLTLSFAFATTASAKKVKKVDNFILFLDHSGSMGMKHTETGMTKIDMALEALSTMNKAVPELDYTSAFFTFAPFKEQTKVGTYNKAAISNAIGNVDRDFEIFGRQTPMGDDNAMVKPYVDKMQGKTALIIFTDGVSNIGNDPVVVTKNMRETYGDNFCVHIVSFADTPKGKKTIEQLRGIFPCTVAADYASLTAPGAMEKYAQDVFYEEVADAPAPAPAPVVAPVPMAKETITVNLNFGFDKAAITDEMIPALEQVTDILNEDASAMAEVAGHTDSTGPEKYNQTLSERRAQSVMDWLTKNGVDASRLDAKGYGESSPKYDNNTREGRGLNRRVEILTK